MPANCAPRKSALKICNRARKHPKPRVTSSAERLDERILRDAHSAGPTHNPSTRAIGYATPQARLEGRAKAIFDERDRRLEAVRERRKQQRPAQRQAALDGQPEVATK